MNVADYDQIRAHLEQPRVVVFDPCAVSLAPDDSDWPQPLDHLRSLSNLPQPSQVRCALAITVIALGRITAAGEDQRVRRASRGLARWLTGESATQLSLEADIGGAEAPSALGYVVDALNHLGQAVRDGGLTVAGFVRRLGPVQMLLGDWWSRCYAVLPVAEVTTAEIEWGDIELPPKHINGDLPGDGRES